MRQLKNRPHTVSSKIYYRKASIIQPHTGAKLAKRIATILLLLILVALLIALIFNKHGKTV